MPPLDRETWLDTPFDPRPFSAFRNPVQLARLVVKVPLVELRDGKIRCSLFVNPTFTKLVVKRYAQIEIWNRDTSVISTCVERIMRGNSQYSIVLPENLGCGDIGPCPEVWADAGSAEPFIPFDERPLDCFTPIWEELKRRNFGCHYERPDELVLFRKETHVPWPKPGNSCLISERSNGWHLRTWAGSLYRAPSLPVLLNAADAFVDIGEFAQPIVPDSIVERFDLVKLS